MSIELPEFSRIKEKLLPLEEELSQLRKQLAPSRNRFQPPSREINILTIKLGEQQFALYLMAILEVIRMVQLTPLPGAPPTIVGLLNLRGEIVPVLDLRLLLDLVAKPYHRNSPIIIIEYENKKRALIVDAIADVISVKTEELESSTGPIPKIEYLLALIRHSRGLITLLDHTRLLSFEQEYYLDVTLNSTENND